MLKKLIADEYGGNQAKFARLAKMNTPQVNRWLSDTQVDGRRITEDSARKIEKLAGKPKYWLDNEGSSEAALSGMTQVQKLEYFLAGMTEEHREAVLEYANFLYIKDRV